MTSIRSGTITGTIPVLLHELTWESVCLKLAQSADLSEMVALCKPGEPHYTASYLLELFLWSHAVPSLAFRQNLVKMNTLGRKKELDLKSHTKLFRFCTGIEAVYCSNLLFATKLERMQQIVDLIPQFSAPATKLLAWLTVARWLALNNNFSLAALALGEYRGLALKLSDGASVDVLGIAHDLLGKGWLKRESGAMEKDLLEDRE